ncbi:MAG: alpha/beta hydrolase [Acidobacteria bacterium]|nr:alpha/beta hydrolase [Acidobacteriota bacterium]
MTSTRFPRPLGRLSALVALAFLALACLPPRPPAASSDAFLDAGGVSLRYTVTGPADGEPVLLLNGLPEDLDVWRRSKTMAALAGYRVILFDERGLGQSAKPHDPAAYGSEMAEDVVRLLDHLGLAQGHVVGYSMGGQIAAKLLVTHPERCASVTVAGSGALLPAIVPSYTMVADALEGRDIGPLLSRVPAPGGRRATTPAEVEEERANARAFLDYLRQSGQDVAAVAALMRGMTGLVVTPEELRQNRVPVLVLYSDEDAHGEVSALTRELAQATVVRLAGETHGTARDAPAFADALLAFLHAHP